MNNLILETPRAKVYEHDNGTYSVSHKHTVYLDGFVDEMWSIESFEKDGRHSSSGYCFHMLPVRYLDDGKTLKERAIEFALSR